MSDYTRGESVSSYLLPSHLEGIIQNSVLIYCFDFLWNIRVSKRTHLHIQMEHIPLDSLFRPMMPAPHNTYVVTTVVSQSCHVALKLNTGKWKYIFVTIVNCNKEENTIYTVAMLLI